ncbi:MAG: ATP synthase F1 subunit delta [Flexistipes sinusarabici]|uniref:ATP synthase subunit delta n=1 Tax=Flexistipes sinusarabici TaxID=2352 RepID=A0A5D0MNK6_FLESI|nr:ATP synthase F1 subunit delta [Flexistipes sinusarabici]TYB33992.1 MAG: ATP synthase F1 subunit delta [Flexistipes sinusarabici]
MIGTVISKRYAGALFEIASEENNVGKVLDELHSLMDFYYSNAEFWELVKNPLIPKESKSDVFSELKNKGVLSDLLLSFTKLLVEKNRLEELENIVESFSDVYRESRGEAVADVKSVIDMDKKIKDELVAKLNEITGKKVSVQVEKDPSLLGGFLAKIKSTQYDASVKGQLEKLKEEMTG